jgi:transcriptional regulator with XRE-family HTH domain
MSVLKNIREKKGFTQVELSKKTGLSLRTIQRLEANNKEPKGHSLKMLAEGFLMKPKTLQEEFIVDQENIKTDLLSIKTINLSALTVLGIPFGNLIVPIYLWNKKKHIKKVDEIGRKIINFQILWSISLSLLLTISPFISRTFFPNTSIILKVLFLMYAFNIFIICKTAIKIQSNNLNFLNTPVRFL